MTSKRNFTTNTIRLVYDFRKMAESEPSSSRTNSLNTSSSHTDENHTHVELKGYLWKRTKLSRKWKKQWFILRNSDLVYGNTPEVLWILQLVMQIIDFIKVFGLLLLSYLNS